MITLNWSRTHRPTLLSFKKCCQYGWKRGLLLLIYYLLMLLCRHTQFSVPTQTSVINLKKSDIWLNNCIEIGKGKCFMCRNQITSRIYPIHCRQVHKRQEECLKCASVCEQCKMAAHRLDVSLPDLFSYQMASCQLTGHHMQRILLMPLSIVLIVL